MAFDGIVTKAVISELNSVLIGSKVNKILQPTKSEIILELYNLGKNYSLLLSSDSEFCRISLTQNNKPNPQNAYNFCMLLRKYLVGGKISSISNYDLERTVQIKFDCYNEMNDLVTRKLYIEIMSRQSNIVLTNENNIIIDSLKHFDSNTRELLPAHEYTFVPINKKSFIELNNFENFYKDIEIHHGEKLSKLIPNMYIGFSKNFIKNILAKYNIDDLNYSKEELSKIYNEITTILNNITENKATCTLIENDFTITSISSSEELQVNYFIDNYYYTKEKINIFQSSRNNLLHIVISNLKKITKKLENINQKLKECNQMETYRLYGELLTANLYKINTNYNLDKIELENYYDNNNLITIPLDKSISVQKNIAKYFKKYNKLKNALEIVSLQKKETEKELDYIESIIFSLENAKTIHDINEVYEEISQNVITKKEIYKKNQNKKTLNKKQENTQIDLDSTIIDGFTVYIGKNNIQNDYLSMKFSNPNDIWFHTQKIHGSHVLLRNSENLDIDEIPENVLFNCAKLAKENSKSNGSLNVSVDYCYAKFVKKVSGSKPGMVIYNNFKTIIVK